MRDQFARHCLEHPIPRMGALSIRSQIPAASLFDDHGSHALRRAPCPVRVRPVASLPTIVKAAEEYVQGEH